MNILIAGVLGVVAAGFATGAAADKVKLTGEQHQKNLAGFYAYAGVTVFGHVFMTVSEPGGKLETYRNHEDETKIYHGNAYVEGDQRCTVYKVQLKTEQGLTAPRCSDVYQLEDGSFEIWRRGSLRATYKVIRAGTRWPK